MAVTLLAAVLGVGGAAAATPLHLGGRLDTETPFILPRTLFMLSQTIFNFSRIMKTKVLI